MEISPQSPIFAVEIDFPIGFFAQLSWCLRILVHCDIHHLKPYIRLISSNYAATPGADWLSKYFDNIILTPADQVLIDSSQVKIQKIYDIEELELTRLEGLTLAQGNDYFEKYFAVKKDILTAVDDFWDQHIGDGPVLGVHYRGTDKKIEATPVSWDRFNVAIKNHLKENPRFKKIFVASDESQFIAHLEEELYGCTVISHPDMFRSPDGNPLHNTPLGDGYQKGREALINCLLLSRCQALIRTTSALSGWACVFNPDMPVQTLNKPFDRCNTFPDSAL